MADAKAYLQQVKLYDTHINNKLEELSRLRAMVTKITTTLKADVVGGGGNQDKVGDAVARIVDLQCEINEAVDDYVDRSREIAATIDQIADADQLAVLHKRYFEYKKWEEIACEMFMTYRNVCYIHGRALQSVSAILEGRQP
jgi:DNA-directed RNA polymerase specialized sigma subunit